MTRSRTALCLAVVSWAAGVVAWAGAVEAQPPKAPPASPAVESPTEEINIAIGETHTVSARGIRNWTDGVPGVIDVKLTADASEFLIAGRRAGTTTLLLIRDDGSQVAYSVNVFARSPATVERELKQWLESFPDLTVRRIGSREVIEGSVRDEGEKSRVDRIAALYPGQVDSMAYVGALKPLAEDAARTAGTYLIRIDFYFVQFDESSGYSVGVAWPASIGGQALQGVVTADLLAARITQGTLTANQPLPQLDLMQAHGWGKVLKHAVVIGDSGAPVKFRSGGSQNFSVNTGLTVGLQSIPYGVELDVVPRFDPVRGDIGLKVTANVSDLTAPGPGTQIPSKEESHLETMVDVKLGQSVVLSGVRLSRTTHTVTGIPILSQIPIIGLLFGSHVDSVDQSQGAIYILPSVLDNVSSAAGDLVDRALSGFESYSGDIEGRRLFDPQPPRGPSPPPRAP